MSPRKVKPVVESPVIKIKTIKKKMLDQVEYTPGDLPFGVEVLGWYFTAGKAGGGTSIYILYLTEDGRMLKVLSTGKAKTLYPQLFVE